MVTNAARRGRDQTHAGIVIVERVHANQCSTVDNKPMIRKRRRSFLKFSNTDASYSSYHIERTYNKSRIYVVLHSIRYIPFSFFCLSLLVCELCGIIWGGGLD